MSEIANSSYLDFTSYGLIASSTTTVQQAYHLSNSDVQNALAGMTVNVALILDRASDPSDVLSGSWAERQTALGSISSGELWAMYGADGTEYSTVYDYAGSIGTILGSNPGGTGDYVTSQESRTIWVQLTAAQFATMFGTPLMVAGYDAATNDYDFLFWNGNLSLPDNIAGLVPGLWVDADTETAVVANLAGSTSVQLLEGPQSIGNSATGYTAYTPPQIAAFYNFPLDGQAIDTALIGLMEPGIGTAQKGAVDGQFFQGSLDLYRAMVGAQGTGTVYTQGTAGQSASYGGGERSLDFGVVGSVNPNSDIVAYVGASANSDTLTAYQSAVWMTGDGMTAGTIAPVVSSSWGDYARPNPASPFYWAYSQIFVDAALQNRTFLDAAGDGGAGDEISNGLVNVSYTAASPYVIQVGGTSLATGSTALTDSTLMDFVTSAQAMDPAVLWMLARTGFKASPSNIGELTAFIETVWNVYYVEGSEITGTHAFFTSGYKVNSTGSGGVDTTRGTPAYQSDYGLTPTSLNSGLTGRGIPDVSAVAGGDVNYLVPDSDMSNLTLSGGTSAATPLWASLVTQFNYVFADQGLPNLGYMNDLLYLASAISPGAFNDVEYGNNISTFRSGGSYTTPNNDGTLAHITPTGYGYAASVGYDLVTGLGSPNGLLLARALTTIAHTQMYYDVSDVLVEGTGWTSGATQSLLFQANGGASDWDLSLGTSEVSFAGGTAGTYAWTAQFAQQVLQSDFASDLVTLFDGYAQAGVYQSTLALGTQVAISNGEGEAASDQAALTADYGFIDFVDGDGSSVEVARAVAYATTAGGADDTDVVVRMRQNGMNDISVMFYEVDDFSGSIGGIAPGAAGYAAAALANAYTVAGGGTSVSGGGYGVFSQTSIGGVDANDHIAMGITSGGQHYWAFASANEVVDGAAVAHLWSYGLNTWGWEDLYGGGDQDFNDLIVQLDFTSAAGSGLLV